MVDRYRDRGEELGDQEFEINGTERKDMREREGI